MDGAAAAACVGMVLVRGTGDILDNLATDGNVEATRALRAHGCRFSCLPCCSRDLNPLEQAVAKLKAHLRRMGASLFIEVCQAMGEICNLR